MIKLNKNNIAVSEVVGTILLLIISVTLFSVVYVSFFSIDVEPNSPSVDLVGTIEDNNLFIEHRGGKDLKLDTKVIMRLEDGTQTSVLVEEKKYLPDEAKENEKWNIGERFRFLLDDFDGYERFEQIDLLVVDPVSNSVIMMGTVEEAKFADISITIDADPNEDIKIGDEIKIIVNAKNEGPVTAEDIVIKDLVKDGLKYDDGNSTTHGDYKHETGIWNIPILDVNEPAELIIKVKVVPSPSETFTQVAVILDGSEGYPPYTSQWEYMKRGLANAITYGYIPHKGLVELTVIQYGTKSNAEVTTPCDNIAQIEIGPVVLTESNYAQIAEDISSIEQLGGKSPLSAGLNLARMTLKNSPNFNPSNAHIINLVLQSIPDCKLVDVEEVKSCITSYVYAKDDATEVCSLMKRELVMTEDRDQINVEIAYPIVTSDEMDLAWKENRSWLTYDIASPNSNFIDLDDNWPPEENGWVRKIMVSNDYTKLFECLSLPFYSNPVSERYNTAELISTKYFDNNPKNNKATLMLKIGE